jgi:hypothetical protein
MTKFILTLSLTLYFSTLKAQVDTIYAIPKKLIDASLKQGTSQYLVFIKFKQMPKQSKTFVWDRKVSVKQVNGKDHIEVVQHWYGADSTDYRYVYSLVDKENYLPTYHKTISQRTGIEAFDFYYNKIKGSDSVANNKKAAFELITQKPLNWELDLETFTLLDLKEGKRFAINFYHPGGRSNPQFYEYKVTGSEKVNTIDGKQIDCWKLRIDYNAKSYAVFYISKKNREVIKMEEDFGMGARYKVKLATNM